MFGYVAAIFLGPLIPLVMYLIGRRRSPFRRFHAARSPTTGSLSPSDHPLRSSADLRTVLKRD